MLATHLASEELRAFFRPGQQIYFTAGLQSTQSGLLEVRWNSWGRKYGLITITSRKGEETLPELRLVGQVCSGENTDQLHPGSGLVVLVTGLTGQPASHCRLHWARLLPGAGENIMEDSATPPSSFILRSAMTISWYWIEWANYLLKLYISRLSIMTRTVHQTKVRTNWREGEGSGRAQGIDRPWHLWPPGWLGLETYTVIMCMEGD